MKKTGFLPVFLLFSVKISVISLLLWHTIIMIKKQKLNREVIIL